MKLPIPVNIITGGLGSGKTTTISRLLSFKQTSDLTRSERWAILVNEFGSLGIDGALLENAAQCTSGEGEIGFLSSSSLHVQCQRDLCRNKSPYFDTDVAFPLSLHAGTVVVRELAGGCEFSVHAKAYPIIHSARVVRGHHC